MCSLTVFDSYGLGVVEVRQRKILVPPFHIKGRTTACLGAKCQHWMEIIRCSLDLISRASAGKSTTQVSEHFDPNFRPCDGCTCAGQAKSTGIPSDFLSACVECICVRRHPLKNRYVQNHVPVCCCPHLCPFECICLLQLSHFFHWKSKLYYINTFCRRQGLKVLCLIYLPLCISLCRPTGYFQYIMSPSP